VNLAELVVVGSRVSAAIPKFKTFARRIFSGKGEPRNLITRAWAMLTNCLNDSSYDSTLLDDALQEAFGTVCRLFDTAAPPCSGTRVAMTASRILDGKLCIFTNYRGRVGEPCHQPIKPSHRQKQDKSRFCGKCK
jgi:hypothetical protein